MRQSFDLLGHFFIVLTVTFTVYGQLVLRWQMSGAGPLPEGVWAKLAFLLLQFLNPWILSGFACAFLASLAWMAAMTRFDLGYAVFTPLRPFYPHRNYAFPRTALDGLSPLQRAFIPDAMLA